MIISKCCEKEVWVCDQGDFSAFYVCYACELPCDTLDSTYLIKDDLHDDPGDLGQT